MARWESEPLLGWLTKLCIFIVAGGMKLVLLEKDTINDNQKALNFPLTH